MNKSTATSTLKCVVFRLLTYAFTSNMVSHIQEESTSKERTHPNSGKYFDIFSLFEKYLIFSKYLMSNSRSIDTTN